MSSKDNKKEESKLHLEEGEHNLLLDHNYDGIQELNHPLPSWWTWIWGITIVHSIGYFVYYEFMKGPSLKDEFNTDYAKVKALQEAEKLKHTLFNTEKFSIYTSVDNKPKAEEVFVNNCLPCHAEGGKGDIGPNLTDDHWLVAKGTAESVYDVVFNGSVDNGMPAWNEVLTPEEIYLATAYVMSVKNTFVKGKEPEGAKVEN